MLKIENIYCTNISSEKAEVAILDTGKVDCRSKNSQKHKRILNNNKGVCKEGMQY